MPLKKEPLEALPKKSKKDLNTKQSKIDKKYALVILQLESQEIDKRILLIKTSKQQKLLRNMKDSASPSTQEINIKMQNSDLFNNQKNQSKGPKGPVRAQNLDFQSMIEPNTKRGSFIPENNFQDSSNLYNRASEDKNIQESQMFQRKRSSIKLNPLAQKRPPSLTNLNIKPQGTSIQPRKEKSLDIHQIVINSASDEDDQEEDYIQKHINIEMDQNDEQKVSKIKRRRKIDEDDSTPHHKQYSSKIGEKVRKSNQKEIQDDQESSVDISQIQNTSKTVAGRLKEFKAGKKDGLIMNEMQDEGKRQKYLNLKQRLEQGSNQKKKMKDSIMSEFPRTEKIQRSFEVNSDSSLGSI